MRGLFVTGTDTGVGKSVLAASVCAALSARGERVAAYKPVVTGLDEPPEGRLPDHELLAGSANAGQSPDAVAPVRFGPPVSPHYAAELASTRIDPERLVDSALTAGANADVVVCEGVGGLLVPLTADFLVADLARELRLPLLIAARPGLGTINHTLLTIAVARAAGLDPLAVVLTPWPARPTGMELSNRATIERLGSVEVAVLRTATSRTLAAAGAELPLEQWLPPVTALARPDRRVSVAAPARGSAVAA